MTNQRIKTKRGAAALYIVLFTTMILTIISMSFTRVMVSETTDTTNNDLSESAYDSALAGIEDAKVAIMKYHDCIAAGYGPSVNGNSCQKAIYYMREGIKSGSCDVVQQVLNRTETDTTEEGGGAVKIQESTSSGTVSGGEMSQAYTCVKIQEELDDYRTTLTSTERVRMIPIRTGNNSAVRSLKISWFSAENYSDYYPSGNVNNISIDGRSTSGKHDLDANTMVPTLLGVDVYQSANTFHLYDLSTANEPAGETDHAKLWLYPVSGWSGNGSTTVVPGSTLVENSDKDTDENVTEVKCSNRPNIDGEFYCSTYINLPNTIGGGRAEDTFYLRLTLPYGAPNTDVSVEVYTEDGSTVISNQGSSTTPSIPIAFSAVQALVDSTGRANDVYRRVEARIELVDTYYPYPEFEIQTSGGNTNEIEKKFYITHDCSLANNGSAGGCANEGNAPTHL